MSRSSAEVPLCPRETGEREKRKRVRDYGKEKIIAIFIGIPSGSLDLRRSGAPVLEPMTRSLNLHINPGVKLCPYLLTFRHSNSRERFMPSNQNNAIRELKQQRF